VAFIVPILSFTALALLLFATRKPRAGARWTGDDSLPDWLAGDNGSGSDDGSEAGHHDGHSHGDHSGHDAGGHDGGGHSDGGGSH
jgi:hypothetical protein